MVEWKISDGLTGYLDALAFMETRVAAIAAGEADECIWLLEHPPLYTAGTSAKPQDLIDPNRFEVHEARRGGQYTYHGPGQRVIYVMLDVGKRGHDVRLFVKQLEYWVIATLGEFNVTGEIREGRVGVWVTVPKNRPWPMAAPPAKTRSPQSASACANGSAFTASQSTSSPTWAISPASFRAAFPNMA